MILERERMCICLNESNFREAKGGIFTKKEVVV